MKDNLPDPIEMLYIESPSIGLVEFRNRVEQLIKEEVMQELEMASDFAEDVLQQFGYNGKSGGLSTLEWAEGIIKRYKKITSSERTKE